MKVLDRRTRKTKKAINDAFWKLMNQKDFEDITIRDITDEADIHRATFYLHYADKYDWLKKTINEMFAGIIADDEALLANNELISYEIALKFIMHCNEHYDSLSIMLHNKGTLFFEKTFKSILLESISKRYNYFQGEPSKKDMTIEFYASAVAGATEWWIRNNRPISLEEMTQHLYELLKFFPGWKE